MPFKAQKFPADKVYFTSDTHFGHDKIRELTRRPFADCQEMDEALIKNWNDTVPPDGIVFHLGDVARCQKDYALSILQRLNGTIYLIVGNHDPGMFNQQILARFAAVNYQMLIECAGVKFYLNHFPFLCYCGLYEKRWQLFGHVHSSLDLSRSWGFDIPRLEQLFPTQYDVGVDNNDFRPIACADVMARIEAQIAAAGDAFSLEHQAATARAYISARQNSADRQTD